VSRVAALVLAAVFAWSGIAKLVRRPDMTPLGLPAWAPIAIGVVEVGLALALLVAPANAGLAALVLLAGFTAFLVPKVGSGEGCGCFGASTKPVSTQDLMRNAALMALAATAAFW
jgi:hypothetical protein